MKISHKKRDGVSLHFRELMSNKDYDDCVCDVVLWENGEGFDIAIETSTGQHKNFALSRDEAHALIVGIHTLDMSHD